MTTKIISQAILLVIIAIAIAACSLSSDRKVSGQQNGGGTNPPTNRDTGEKPAAAGRWTLVSTTAVPENKSGWTYNAQSASAHYDVYNGDKHDFQWTKPPAQIDANGFTVSFSVQCQSQPNNVCASIIGASGSGLESDGSSNDRKAEANGNNGSIGSGQKSVTFKPSPNSNELEMKIGLGWGDVEFIYKYRRAG